MNFFAHILQQPPVPDKDSNNNNDSQLESDQFTVTKGKTLKGFNDDFSEIQLGSDIINDDSINEIQQSHKLLSGQSSFISNNKSKRHNDRNLSEINNQPLATNPPNFDQYNYTKDPKSSKYSRQHKHSPQQKPTAEFRANLHREKYFYQSIGHSNNPKLFKRKKITQQLILNLAQLKKLKSNFMQMISDETTKYKRHFETIKINLEVQMRKRLSAYANSIQNKVINSNTLKNLQNQEEQQLKVRLKQAQALIKQHRAKVDELSEENEMLQEKQFDLEQKIVGVDLQVQNKFEQKRKQLERKIVEQVTKNIKSSKQLNLNESENKSSTNDHMNRQSSDVLENLVKQNEFFENKIKSYEKILIQADQIRKMKQSLEQRQMILVQKQSELEMKKSYIESQMKANNKKSVFFNLPEENLSEQVNQFKHNLKFKQQEPMKWEQQLKGKVYSSNQKSGDLPNENSPKFQSSNSLTYSMTFQKPVQQKISFRSPSDEQFCQKIQALNSQKVPPKQGHNRKPSDLDTFRNGQNPKSQGKSDSQSFFKQQNHPKQTFEKITYDPRQHEAYEKFDMQEKKKARNLNLDNPRRNSPNYSVIYNQVGANKKTDFDNISRESTLSKNKLSSFNLSQHTESKKPSAEFYQPSIKNTFKYQPQFVQKPISTPIVQHISASRMTQNFKSKSPQNREQVMGMYRGSQNNFRDKYFHSPNDNNSTFSRSSKDTSILSYNTNKGIRVGYHGYDMNKSKPKFELVKLNDLGNKIQSLKNELKNEIDTIY